MPTPQQQALDLFIEILRAIYVENDVQKALCPMKSNVIGIGMGSQGMISSRQDIEKIISNKSSFSGKGKVERISFENIQCDCIDDRFATVCGVAIIHTHLSEKIVASRIGQLMNFVRENDKWLVSSFQATPLFNHIDELEAFPLSFAENVLELIHESQRYACELKRQAERDNMTGLYRKMITEKLISERLKEVSPERPGAFFMIDLDYFKRVNDVYGHSEGDKLIRAAASCIQAQTRSGDIAGRLGGDEFCVYFQGEPTIATVSKKAEEICKSIKLLAIGTQTRISCSIGIAFCCDPTETFDNIYRRADKALYSKKRKGKDGYSIYCR